MSGGRLLRQQPELSIGRKLLELNWGLLLLLAMVCGCGLVMLYSAAGGSMDPWASRQAQRFAVALLILLAIAVVDIRFWFRLAYPIYFGVLLLLTVVEFFGSIGMGAQRWVDLGFFQLQPSELMKVALVLALARYFHGVAPEDIGRIGVLIPPALLALMPAGLVLIQPDLGTGGMLLMAALMVFFLAGVRLWMFGAVIGLAVACVPVGLSFLHDYQLKRIETFLNPESDPLGAGYHIMQSKIALGSGGIWGKGYMLGTQSNLNFLPEKQTDFIFTMLAEEFGLVGGLLLLGLYILLIAYGFLMAFRIRSQFGRLLVMGVTANLFLYVFINIAMVIGLIPVVGIPLPMISYGGTVMLSLMAAYGLVMSAHIHRDQRISRRGLGDDG